MIIETDQEVLSKQLGVSYKPSEKLYEIVRKLCNIPLTKGCFKNAFEIKGAENLKEDYLQFFLSNHVLLKDPFIVQSAIALASNNFKPIPTLGYRGYVLNPFFGFGFQKLFTLPVFSRKDGYIENAKKIKKNMKREKSLDYAVDYFFKYGRLLTFPEGHISRNGKLDIGYIGSADLSWRVYNRLEENSLLKKDKKGFKIMLLNISYSPREVFRNRKKGSKMIVRFGKSIDFEKKVIDKFYSFKSRIKNSFMNEEEKEEFKKELKIDFMKEVMKEIGLLMTINPYQIFASLAYNSVLKGNYSISEDYFKNKLEKIVNGIRETDLYLSDHFSNEESINKAYNYFLEKFEKEGYLENNNFKLELKPDKILFEPEDDRKIKHENKILWYYNNLKHLEEYKDIEKAILSD